MDFSLSPAEHQLVQQFIEQARAEAETLVNKTTAEYESVSGTAWRGAANVAALNKTDEFQLRWKNLQGILDHLQTSMQAARNMVLQEDESSQAAMAAIVPDGGGGMHFERL